MARLDDKPSEGFGHRGVGEHNGDEKEQSSRGHYQGGRSRSGFHSRGRGRGGLGYGSRGGGGSKFTKSYNPDVQEQVEELYKKKFKFQDKSDSLEWHLPDSAQLFSTDTDSCLADLQLLKSQLNQARDKLESKETISWNRHTNFTNRAGIIVQALRRDYGPEMCTASWVKLQEMLWSFDVIPKSAVKYNSVHLCEAPGAFVASLNHFLKTHRTDCDWQWKALTLNPYYEGNTLTPFSDQDMFMSETRPHWFVGPNNTGDITLWENVVAFKGVIKKDMEEIHLVTADGALSVFGDPNNQEGNLSNLLYCETIASLLYLAKDGSFILKTFTTFEPQTGCLLYLLACCFKEVNVFKPVTSKSSNSEQYVVCVKYKGRSFVSKKHWEQLINHFDGSSNSMFPMATIPQSFLSQLISCADKFSRYQVDSIEENVQLYDCMKASKKQFITEVKELVCDEFKRMFKLKSLSKDKAIVKNIHLDGTPLHLTVVQPVRGDLVREWLAKRNVPDFLSQLAEIRARRENRLSVSVDDDIPEAKLPRLDLDEGVRQAVEHVLSAIGFEGVRSLDKSSDHSFATLEIESDDVQWLNRGGGSATSYDLCDDIKSLDGLRVKKVTNSRFCHSDVIRRLGDTLQQSQIMNSSHIDEHTHIASHVSPSHALSDQDPPFFLNNDALHFAALDYLTDFIKKSDEVLLFMDLAGAPSGFSHYTYWKRQHSTKGWGLVRSENPVLGPGQVMERLAPWETFQVLGPHNGVNICDTNTIRSLCAGVENYCPNGVELIIGNVPDIPFGAHPPGQSEILVKQHLLSQLICSCKILGKGGMFVCRCYELLTRFSAGLVYILYKLFQQVTILKPMTSLPTSPERFILCRGFLGCKAELSDSLLDINSYMTELAERNGNENEVLEIVPMHLLLEENFHRYLTLSNERIARYRSRMISKIEHLFQNPENTLTLESQQMLCKGTREILDLPESPF